MKSMLLDDGKKSIYQKYSLKFDPFLIFENDILKANNSPKKTRRMDEKIKPINGKKIYYFFRSFYPYKHRYKHCKNTKLKRSLQ